MFTETLIDFLKDNENKSEWQGVIAKFNSIPSFVVETDTENITFDMYVMFKQEYGNREIGQEDEEKFFYEVNRQIQKTIVEFNPKIKVYMTKWSSLLSRKESLSSSEANEYSNQSEGNALDYINPINATSQKLSGKTASNSNDGGSSSKTKTYDMIYSLTGKSNVDLMNDLLNLRNIYLSALESFKDLFMLVY